MEAVSKYEPLLQYLLKSDQVLVTLSFRQVEEILDAPLPSSAHRYPAWWENEVSGSHTQSNIISSDTWLYILVCVSEGVQVKKLGKYVKYTEN